MQSLKAGLDSCNDIQKLKVFENSEIHRIKGTKRVSVGRTDLLWMPKKSGEMRKETYRNVDGI